MVPQGEGDIPKHSGFSTFTEYYVVGGQESLQKESAQSGYPYLKEGPKCAKILGYFDIGLKPQNQTTFWMFSRSSIVRLS